LLRKEIVNLLIKQASKYWSGYANLLADANGYAVQTSVMYVGTPEDGDDINSFDEFFKDVYPDNIVSQTDNTFDTFLQKLLSQVTLFALYPYVGDL